MDYFDGKLSDEDMVKKFNKYLRLLFETFKMCVLFEDKKWIFFNDCDEDDLVYLYFTAYISEWHPKMSAADIMIKARKKVENLKHPISNLIDYMDRSKDEHYDEYGYLQMVYKAYRDELIHYMKVVNHLIWNLSNEEACSILGWNHERVVALGIDCRAVVSDEVKKQFMDTNKRDLCVSSINKEQEKNRLDVVGHKKFWRAVKNYESMITIRNEKYGGQAYV